MRGNFILIMAISGLLLSCQKDISDASFNEESEARFLPVTESVNGVTGGYYIYFPKGYDHAKTTFPLLLFLHGKGQYGNGSSDLKLLLNEAIPEVINSGRFPHSFNVNGTESSMVVICPQYKIYPSPEQVLEVVMFALNKYKLDPHQVHISGMSEGGSLATEAAAANPNLFASLITFSGVTVRGDLPRKCRSISEAKLPMWIFHNDLDEYVSIETAKTFLTVYNAMQPAVPPRFTIFPAWGLYGHDSWTRATNPRYKENGMNIYEWMLQFRRN